MPDFRSTGQTLPAPSDQTDKPEALIDWHRQGKIKYRVELVKGLRNAPAAMNRSFDGANSGKLALAFP